jgi:hypothetical protein
LVVTPVWYRVAPDDLVELQQVHVTRLSGQRGVQHDEDVVLVPVQGRDMVALPARGDEQRVALQRLRQHSLGVVVPAWAVDPGEPFLMGKERVHLVGPMTADPPRMDERQVHDVRMSRILVRG